MLRTLSCCAVLVAVALAAPAATWAAAAPAEAVTLAPTFTAGIATLQATVNPHGLPTTAHFEYGSDTGVIGTTPDIEVGAGDVAVPVSATINVIRGARYFVAVYAENTVGEVDGEVVAFDFPRAPVLNALTPADVTTTSATLHVGVTGSGTPVTLTGSVVPGSPITVVGRPQPLATSVDLAPLTVTADGDVALSVMGLTPGRNYRWTVTGTSAGGVAVARGLVTTPAAPVVPPPALAPRPVASAKTVVYGARLLLTGALAKPGVAFALQQQTFPFSAPFTAVPGAASTSDANGNYALTIRALQRARYAVAAPGFLAPTAVNAVTVRVRAAVASRLTRARHHRFAVAGRILSGGPGKVSLYRIGQGRVGVAVGATRGGAFRFAARALRPGRYEVRAVPSVVTGIDAGRGAAFTVPRR
jgi:hypothetical protein